LSLYLNITSLVVLGFFTINEDFVMTQDQSERKSFMIAIKASTKREKDEK